MQDNSPAPANTLCKSTILCEVCGEECAEKCEVRIHGIDQDTGYQDSTLICNFCIADEEMGNRNPQHCVNCNARLGMNERRLCSECEADQPDYLSAHKASIDG